MHVALQDQLAFRLTGRLSSGALEPVDGCGLLPALFAPYRDLAALRHDFPLVLTPGVSAQSLSRLFDATVAEAGTGEAAERLGGHARRMERALRRQVADAGATPLEPAWRTLSAGLVEADPEVRESLDRLHRAMPRDSVLVDCDAALAARLLAHEWSQRHGARKARLAALVADLTTQLDDILKADFAVSPEGRRADRLRASMGSALEATFNFDAMSDLLDHAAPAGGLDDARRRRIAWLLTVLRTQRFAPPPGSPVTPYGFAFDTAAAALQAWRDRLPELAELAKATAMARLEAAGEYDEATHDPVFAAYGNDHSGPNLLTDAPDYLVCVVDQALTAEQASLLLEALGAGLPFKVLVQTGDLLEGRGGMAALGSRVRGLAAAALGLADVYVLQAGASQLFSQLARVQAGLAHEGPALFSVFSGAGPANALPPYLVSAAAVESRAFPAFAYDPDAGADWASRFSVDANPQAGRDWAVHPLDWEDAAHQRQGETIAFTLVDFLACDPRAASHLARVVPGAWNGQVVPVTDSLAEASPNPGGPVPGLIMADAQGGLHKVLVDDALLGEARRCLGRWRALQELGGIGNSHAARAVEAARLAWSQSAAPAAPTPVAEPAATPAVADDAPVEAERPPGEPYIETARCSSCNECVQLNDRMFAYDANRQATIRDPAAGTYRQLVEAAESCQVSVIHPGKPRDDGEPGLEELLVRATPFL